MTRHDARYNTISVGTIRKLKAADSVITVADSVSFTGSITVLGSITYGDAVVDNFIIKGRVSTSTAAGASLTLDATYAYGEAIELRYAISSWAGIGSSFKALYLRSEADLGGAYGLRGAEIYGVMDTSTTTGLSNLQPLYTEMLVKASASDRTLTGGTSIEANISVENQTGTLTLTDNIYCVYAKAQTGTGIADYTKVGGIKIAGRDDGTPRVFGSAIDISDPEATVCTWTKGVNITTTCTTAISVSTGTFTTALSIAGTVTTGVAIGSSGTPLTLAAYTSKAIAVYTTCASTDAGNSVEPFYMKSTMTGIGGVGGGARFHLYTNVSLGGWANALKAYTEFGSSGAVTGLASALRAETVMPNASPAGGNYACVECELGMQASSGTGASTQFVYAEVYGDGKATFDTSGYVMKLAGLSVGSGKVFQANTAAAATHALRISIEGTPYYIMLTSVGA